MVVMDSKWYVMSKNVSKCFQNGNIWKHFCRNSRNGQKKTLSDFQIFPFWKHLETFFKHFATFFWDIFTKWTKIKTIRFPNISILETFGNIFVQIPEMDKNKDYPISKYFHFGNFWKHFCPNSRNGQK